MLFASMRAIGRFTLEKQHHKWCSSKFSFMFWPFEYPMDGLEFCLRNKLRLHFCLFLLPEKLSKLHHKSGCRLSFSKMSSSNIQDVIYDCCVTGIPDLGVSAVWTCSHRCSTRAVTAMWGLCRKYLVRGKKWDRCRWSTRKRWGVSWVHSENSMPADWLLWYYSSSKGENLDGI